jgi:transcriptional regulator with XRE-family HTH domain
MAAPKAKAPKIEAHVAAVGRRLREEREHAKVLAADICRKTGVNPGNYSAFEHGRKGLQTGNLLAVLAAAAELGLDVQDYILRGVGEPGRKVGPVYITATPELARDLLRLQLRSGSADQLDDERPRARRKKQ